LIVSFSEIGTIHGGKGERRVLTEYFGDARGSIEKSSKGPKFKSSSTTIDGFKKSSNVDLVFGNLYQEVKTAKNRFKQPHWGKAQDIRGKDSFNLDGVTWMELDAFLTVKNKKVMDAFESRYPLFNKNADTEMIQNRIRARYGMVLDTVLDHFCISIFVKQWITTFKCIHNFLVFNSKKRIKLHPCHAIEIKGILTTYVLCLTPMWLLKSILCSLNFLVKITKY
jgi:hypothetical protein